MNHQQEIEGYFANQESLLIEAVSRLVSIRSVRGKAEPGAPFGSGPAAALEEALKLAGEWGLNPINHDGYVGTADLNDKETVLHILGHLDVVNEGTGWSVTKPYEPKVVDGCLYGRGTDDDKGPIVASLLALKCVKDLGLPMKANVRVIMGTDEESGSNDLAYYYDRNPFAPQSFTPDSGFPVINVEKGGYKATFTRSWPETAAIPRLVWFHGGVRINVLPGDAHCAVVGFSQDELLPIANAVTEQTGVRFNLSEDSGGMRIDAKGIGCHAAMPKDGNNAITALLILLDRLPLISGGAKEAIHDLLALLPHGDSSGTALGIAQADEISGDLTLAFSLLEIEYNGLKGQFDARVPICATKENCSDIAKAAFAARGFQLSGEMTAPHHTPADSPFVKTLLQCYESYTGRPGECLKTGGGTYVHDIPGGVAFGASMPGFDSHLHGPDERTNVSDLLTAAKIFAQAVVELCGE